MPHRDELAEYERQFRRSGLPLFIEDYSASEDIFTRAAPFFALVFVGEMVAATEVEWPLLVNVAAALAGLAILITTFGLVNRVRGRAFLSLPTQVGWPELAAFVLVPALLPLIFGLQWRQVAGIALGNTLLVGLAYLVIGYGLVATVFWGLTRLGDELAASLARLVRALPLLLVFSLVLFVNAEMWQMFASMPREFVILVMCLFAGLGLVFLAGRMPSEVRALEAETVEDGPPLTRRQRINVGVTLAVSQSLQVLVVSAGIGAFFVVFGALAIGPEAREAWTGMPPQSGWTIGLFGHEIQFTETLLRVSGGIASFTGLYYAIAILTDTTYRQEFLDGMEAEFKGVFEARRRYLALRSSTVDAAAETPAENAS